jgi:hypothetical protein
MTALPGRGHVFLYDVDASDCEYAAWLLGKYGVGLPDSGLELAQYSNRNELLRNVSECSGPSVALIDMRGVEREDFAYVGHRIIDAVRRHPELASRCRPVGLTRYPSEDVCALAKRFGAYALISQTSLDGRDAGQRALLPLVGFLHELLETPAAAPGSAVAFRVFPTTGVVKPESSSEDERTEIAKRFRGMPDAVAKPYFWHIIRYYADAVDRESVVRWVATDYVDSGASESQVNKQISELSDLADVRYRSKGVDLSELARDLLVACPHRRVAPTDTLSARTMHRLVEVRRLANAHDVVQASWIDPEALDAVRRVANLMLEREEHEPIHSRSGQWAHTRRLEEVLGEHEPDETRRAKLRAALVRGTHALFDTYTLMVGSTTRYGR